MAAPKHEPFVDFQKKTLDASMHLAQITLQGAQSLAELHVDATRKIIEDNIEGLRAMMEAPDPRTAIDSCGQIMQRNAEKIMACGRQVGDLAASTQNDMVRALSEQFSAMSTDLADNMSRMIQGLPVPGTEMITSMQTAIESTRSAMEQMARTTQEAFSNLTNITSRAAGAATRTATAAIVEPFAPRAGAREGAEPAPAMAVAGGKKAVKHQ